MVEPAGNIAYIFWLTNKLNSHFDMFIKNKIQINNDLFLTIIDKTIYSDM